MQQIQHPPIQKAWQQLHALSGDERTRHEAFIRERAMRDAITEKAEAEARGEARGRAHFLLRLLKAKFGDIPTSLEERLHSAEPAQLEYWGERVLFAPTLEQVFSRH